MESTGQGTGRDTGRDDALTIRISVGFVGVGTLVVAVGVTVLRLVNAAPPVRSEVEATIGTLAFGLALAIPGILTLMARHDRPVLLLPAAIMLVPFSFLSFALGDVAAARAGGAAVRGLLLPAPATR